MLGRGFRIGHRASENVQQSSRRNHQSFLPRCGEVLQIPGHQIIRPGRAGAFEKHIVMRIRTYPYRHRWPDPQRLLADGSKAGRYAVFIQTEPRAGDDLLILRQDVTAEARLEQTAESEREDTGRRSKRLQQRRNDDIVENNSNHEPGRYRDSCRAARAAAISASISSIES